jgi:hypothetical protein
MTYEVNVKILIKTMGIELTHSQMKKIIERALWKCPEFRDIDLYEYEGDTLEDKKIFSDVIPQISEAFRASS